MTMTRSRRDRLAAALRHFGLVDRFNLAELLTADAPPSEAAVAQRLRRFPDALPPSVTAATLANYIVEELKRAESSNPRGSAVPGLLIADAEALSTIPTGTETAGRYHDQIFRILSGVFVGRLVEPRKEQRQFQGRKRIDIVFRNADQIGFFAELQRHHIKAPYVPAECKNYSTDLDNPEFDQLSGRLNERIGMFGIMVVRRVDDRKRLDAHRRDRRAKNEWLLVLDDEDVLAMLAGHLSADPVAVDATLRRRFEPLVFD